MRWRYGIWLLALALQPLVQAQAKSAWPFWSSYQQRFISQDGRVMDFSRGSMTTSEGQSYALFFSLVADDAREFERIRVWTEDNLAGGSLAENLPAWSWGMDARGAWGVLDRSSAADADLWIAYSLLEAGRLWRNTAYSQTGRALLDQMVRQEVAYVPGVGAVLMPGPVRLFSGPGHWILNESYAPLPLLFAAAQADPGGPWRQMAADLPQWLAQASPSGFAMNWVEWSNAGFTTIERPGPDGTGAGGAGSGSYDAIRVYLWAGMTNRKTPGAEKILSTLAPMARLLAKGERPPEIVSPSGVVLSGSSPAGFAAALEPFLLSSGETAAAGVEAQRVKAQFDRSTGLLGADPHYFDQNLALFALGWREGRYRFAPDGSLRVRWED